jgi:hypothetical protein
MGKGKPVVVGDRRFSSKKAAQEFVQGILRSYQPGQRISGAHAAFLRDLIELHPERDAKVGGGIAGFTVERNEGSNGFWLTRVDGTRTDWSFLSCLTPPTPEMEARARVPVRSAIAGRRVS